MAGERKELARLKAVIENTPYEPEDNMALAQAVWDVGYRRAQPADHGGEVERLEAAEATLRRLASECDQKARAAKHDNECGVMIGGRVAYTEAAALIRAALDATTSARETTSGGGGR